ncbi:MAG: FAD-dependent oxidoreductase, partial [bacterium]
SPTSRDAVAKAELELRRRQAAAVELFREFVPGCEKAFMARTSPKLCIRRGRRIACDYDITHQDVVGARHFDDEVMVYGFHDMAPRLQVRDGGTYGVPYRALRVKGLDNLLAAGMLITSDRRAHMSTRNTVCCMGQGQGAGTAAALCAARGCGTRALPYRELRQALEQAGVYFEA